MNLGIYIQVPFCQTKCAYCNFQAGPVARGLYGPYARAVAHEIARHVFLYHSAGIPEAVEIAGLPVDTVYLGGGTPSLLDPSDLAAILDSLRANFLCSWSEVTLEADPETVRSHNAAAWKSAGVNRISLGAQSFNDQELIAAGRMHRRDDTGRAVEILRAAGFANISLDLIAGLPYQTSESWQLSLDEAMRLCPQHISIYLLEIDEGSRLGRESLAGGSRYGAAAIPDDDAMVSSYELACRKLASAGYQHYEISNWALPGRASQHNLKYWRRQPYLGFGTGAHSFSGNWRWANAHDPAAYVSYLECEKPGTEGKELRLPIEQREEVTRVQALEEEFFLGLRELDGIDLDRIEKQYGAEFAPRIDDLLAQGLVEREGSRLRLAPERLAVSNEVFVALLGERPMV